MLKKNIYFLLFIIHFSFLFAQSIHEPTYNTEIYKFLDRQAQKGIITFFDDIRPITRMKVAKKLKQLNTISINQSVTQSTNLTAVEKAQLDFFNREYAFELKFLEGDTAKISEVFNFGETDRFNSFKYYDKNFTFRIDPVFQIKYDFAKKNYMQFGGVELKGRISDNIGYYFSYRDFMEDGENVDNNKLFTTISGVKNHRRKLGKHSEYSETRGGINIGWSWGNFSFAKDFLQIGSSYQGSVILSDKAPSFPHMSLLVEPVDWFKYNFIHAWLDSKLIDSTSIRETGIESTRENRSLTFSKRPKYYVEHSFSFQPYQNWWLTFGESIIYGDEIEPVYFIPVFLRLADHYNFIGPGDSGDNAQIFFNTSYVYPKIKSKIYFSLFIDEMSLTDLLTGDGDNANVFAWTYGLRFTNPLWANSYFALEYNAVKPYAYMNADPLHQYTSSDYQLGHWLGSNAVQYYFQFEQYFTRALKLESFFQYVKKGSKESINDYYNRVTSTYPLLSGNVSNYSEAGASLIFNPYHDLFFQLDYSYIFKADGRFKDEYRIDEGASLSTSVRYGF